MIFSFEQCVKEIINKSSSVMACCYNLTRSLVLFFLLVGFVGIVLSGLVDFWWQLKYQDKYGESVTADQGMLIQL